MSTKDQNRGMIDAYQKMLDSGQAFKEVDLSMQETPSIAEAKSSHKSSGIPISDNPLGDKIETPDGAEYHNDYTQNDSIMEQKINSLRNKLQGGGGAIVTKSGKQELAMLKKRVDELEEALMLVMETHEKLLG